MQLKFLSLALLAEYGYAQVGRMPMLRFSCSQLVVERLDPLVNPGMNPSPHVHQIVGMFSGQLAETDSLHFTSTSRATSIMSFLIILMTQS